MIKISTDLLQAKKILEKEGLVAIPSETVYGLAGSIYSHKAIDNIFKTKNRPSNNPLIIHIDSYEKLADLVEEIPEKLKN